MHSLLAATRRFLPLGMAKKSDNGAQLALVAGFGCGTVNKISRAATALAERGNAGCIMLCPLHIGLRAESAGLARARESVMSYCVQNHDASLHSEVHLYPSQLPSFPLHFNLIRITLAILSSLEAAASERKERKERPTFLAALQKM